MDVTLLYFDGCPNWKVADERLAEVVAERADITVARRQVRTIEEAVRVGFHGSPRILVNGVDAFADADAGMGLACRVYATPGRAGGAPHSNSSARRSPMRDHISIVGAAGALVAQLACAADFRSCSGPVPSRASRWAAGS